MKKLTYIAFILFILHAGVQKSIAQYHIAGMNSLDSNFFKTRDSAEAYYNTYPLLKTTPGSGYKDYLRWEEFWRDRVDYPNSNKNCTMKKAHEKLATYTTSSVCGKNSTDEADWKIIGQQLFLLSI
jgi:hypothetical protein